jgi:hypothetical protein
MSMIVLAYALLISGIAQGQAIEAVYSLNFDSTASAKAAMNELFADDDLKGSKATLYEADFGVMSGASHLIVADYANYAARDELDPKRVGSHGWAKFLLATDGTESVAADLAIVVDDYGTPRHESEYLVVFLMQISDVSAYRAALKNMNDSMPGPGGTRLVALRTGSTEVSHAVLVGAPSFAAANEYLDELFASDGYATFVGEVGDIRTLIGVEMLSRVGAWGY